MANNQTLHSAPVNFIDYTDLRKVEVHIASNLPTVQIYDTNKGDYTPDWSKENSHLELKATVFLDSENVTNTNNVKIQWGIKNEDNSITYFPNESLTNKYTLTIDRNVLTDNEKIITYVCKAEYRYKDLNKENPDKEVFAEISFARADTGRNGVDGIDGADGTSITILGTYDSLEALKAAHPTGSAGDSYIVQGNLWVWAVDDAEWEDVGNIQGAPGKDGQDAKAIFLNANTQIFKVGKSGIISPTKIQVSVQPVNIPADSLEYSYSTDGGQTFLSATNEVSRNGTQITITGADMTTNSITIKVSGEQYQDTFTVYKVFDGSDGKTGNDGAPAPIAFLTNESIGFTANSKGEIASTSAVTNVVAFVGTTSAKPTIGTLSGVPTGMAITQEAFGNEISLTLAIDDGATLGDVKSNNGRIKIPVTIPSTPAVTTNLYLGWNKVNAGRSVSSIAARYAVSNSNITAPTTWNITIPIRDAGQYLWMADYITYDDGTNATVGPRVVTGDVGSPGISITSVKSYFANNQSNTSAPATSANWTLIPARQTGYYTWRKDLITYSNDDSEYTTPVCITGDKGDKGIDGVTYYTWIKYADTPTSGMSDSPDGKLYMGIAYNKTTSVESTNYSDYTWALIKGTNGTNGKNGQTYYTWVKYADDVNGTNMSDDPFNKHYIGLAYNKTSATESTIASDYQWSLFRGADGIPGEDAVTFQVYSEDGYILSNSTPRITLQTFAYIGDTQITGDVTYQWAQIKDGIITAISGANGSSYDVYHSDVSFANTYMCTMTFKGVDYSGVVTIDDKNDINTIFSSKPTSYAAGDIWVVGSDYAPLGYEIGTVLKAEHTNNTYNESDWVMATKYDEHIKALEDNLTQYNQYFSFDSQTGLRISARDSNGNASQFSTTLSNDKLSFNQGDEAVAYIESNKLKIKEAEIVSPLTVTGVYSGSTMQQAPIINIGNFSIVVESNGSLSIVANT